MKRSPARNARKKYRSGSKTTINRSVRKKIVRIGLIVGVFLISFLFLFSYTFFKYLNQKFASALSSSSYSIQDDQIPTISYIVAKDFKSDPIVVKKVNFIIFDKIDKRVFMYDLPVNISYSLPGKFGSETLEKTFALGGLNSDERLVSGATAVNRSIFKLFGFKVDKFVLIDERQEEFFDNIWREGGVFNLVSLKNVSNLGDSLKTDLDIREFYNIISFVHSLPQDRISEMSNSPEDFFNTSEFDNSIREFTYESFLAKERKNISVLNGTESPGLAAFGTRVISNFGGRVVSTQNTSKTYDKSVIIADDINSQTVSFLSRVFKINSIISKEEALGFLESEIDRSDVVVIFGFDTLGDLY